MALISLTTDFGQRDGYVGIMKAIMLSLCPQACLVDLSHELSAWDIAGAAWILQNSVSYFPKGSVHLAIVDPQVGGSRRPVVIEAGGHFFVGPDNGVFTHILNQAGEKQAHLLDKPEWWRPQVSRTFHGRDIFAPVAARLASGIEAHELGSSIESASLTRLPLSVPRRNDNTVEGQIVYIDHFGNLITNISADSVSYGSRCFLDSQEIGALSETYASRPPGTLVALVGSHGCVELAANQKDASRLLKASIGMPVRVQRVE